MSNFEPLTSDERGIVLPCPQCQRPNRIPYSRLPQTGRCGNCRATLPLPGFPVGIATAAGFSALVRTATIPVFIDFWAPWCGPCKTVGPQVDQLAALASGELLVAKVNTEALPDIASSLNIRSIPTFAVFAAGRELDRMSGAVSAVELRAFAKRALANPKAAQ